jgi:nucleotide-binding universal stress UspA family protein
MGRIVVGVDESPGAAAALRWAVREADVRRCPLTAVLAWGFLDQHHPTPGMPFDPAYGETDAAAALETIVATVVKTPQDVTIEETVVNDLPAAALLDACAGADLLVVGARGLGPVRSLLLGSVSQACLHHATCPVGIVREGIDHAAESIERIVVGIDGSETAGHALRWSLAEGRAHQASVEVVHAWSVPYSVGAPFVAVFDPAPMEAAARRTLDAAVDSADTSHLPAPVTRTLSYGGASAALLDSARDADLVVVGSRGFGGFKGLVLGSVSHQVAHHATCPVIVLPAALDSRDEQSAPSGSSSLIAHPSSLTAARRGSGSIRQWSCRRGSAPLARGRRG